MNRSDFLRTLGLGATGLLLPTNSFVSTHSIKVYDNYVRGLTHYDFYTVKNELKEGDALELLRETDNPYDSFAIQVNYQGFRLGYLAAYENIVLANMLDTGVALHANVSQLNLKRSMQEWLAVSVSAELVIPKQKLIDSMLAENRADDAIDKYRKGPYFR